ncbi:Uncharacterized protein GY17_00001944 [Cryptosporidium hominis]|uniref:Uncharacterized protein n=1 Tax=Cryptosporidium hominis TaxID=237895 RepID=A0ABX5BET3_CRYHO|nr:hypothetical protein [Cryptosporidium hominis TU502]PPS94846.1 Uncharacterized protein GY17_00001944 [Cryptosporidium hominis]|eukprot:PPS94846.1 Uncharacterized protein GY17_00001944 [Cryptosporidium hominis]
MEEGYDWDQISSFQIVDGMNISSSSLLDDELLITSPDSSNNGNSVSLEQREFSRPICSPLSQFLVGSDGSNSKNVGQKHFSQHQHTNSAGGAGGSNFNLNNSHSSIVGESQHYGLQSGLTNSGNNIRDNSIYNTGYQFNDTEKISTTEKEFTKRKRPYSNNSNNNINVGSNSSNRIGNCTQNSLSGITRSVMGIGGIGAGVTNNSLTKTPTKTRTRKVRESSDDFGNSSSGPSVHSKSGYSSNSSGESCSFGSSSNISEDLNSVKYYEGFKLPLGDLGRKMLLKKLREIHTQNPTKMEKALTDHGLSYTRIRFASVQQLFKISYVCDVFDYALSIHCEFGRPRHRDSSKSVQLSSVNSNSNMIQQQSHSNISSRRVIDSQQHNNGLSGGAAVQGGISEKFESHSAIGNTNGGVIPRGQGLLDDSSKVLGKLETDLDTYTPETSPCSHRSYSSSKSLYSKDSSLISNTPLNKIEHDITSPISIFSTTSGSPSSQRKRRGSAKSSYNFSPPPIPVTNSPIQSGDPKDISSLNPELSNFMNNQNLINYNIIQGNVSNNNMNGNSTVSGFSTQSDVCTSHFPDHQQQLHHNIGHYNNINNHIQNGGRAPHHPPPSYHKKHEEHEPLDSMISMNSGSDSILQKPAKRQKIRSKKKNTLADIRSEPPTQATYSYSSSTQPGINNGSSIFVCGDIDEIYCTSTINTEVTPFYQPESEIAHLGEFETSHHSHNYHNHHQDSIHFISSTESHDQNIPICSAFGSPFDSSLIISSSLDTESSQNSGIITCDSPTSFYLYSQPNISSNYDEYMDSSCLNGFLTQGLNSIEMLNSSELEMDNFDIGCPLISI